MPNVGLRALRRLAVPILGVALLLGADVALPTAEPATESATAALAGSADVSPAATFDSRVRGQACSLLGRDFLEGAGCARDRCVPPAVLWRKFMGAEACALPGQPEGYGFAATVPPVECRALHRRWIVSANYCASQPDRSIALTPDAPQCLPPASVYVTLTETEGAYDECLTPGRADRLAVVAAARGTTLAEELARRQRATQPSGGVLVVGDSVTWRGSDELGRLRPDFTVDAQPARQASELEARLVAFRALHGEPTGLVVQLGTNVSPAFDRADLAAAVSTLPDATRVMFVVPYVEDGGPSAAAFADWMLALASARPRSCVADWPAYVRSHPGMLQDGIHPEHDAELDWARWLVGSWDWCVSWAE